MIPIIGVVLGLAGLGLVALAKALLWIHIGAYLVLAGVVWLFLYMVFHKEDREKVVEREKGRWEE